MLWCLTLQGRWTSHAHLASSLARLTTSRAAPACATAAANSALLRLIPVSGGRPPRRSCGRQGCLGECGNFRPVLGHTHPNIRVRYLGVLGNNAYDSSATQASPGPVRQGMEGRDGAQASGWLRLSQIIYDHHSRYAAAIQLAAHNTGNFFLAHGIKSISGSVPPVCVHEILVSEFDLHP